MRRETECVEDPTGFRLVRFKSVNAISIIPIAVTVDGE